MLHRALASKAAAGRALLDAPVLTPAIFSAISAAHLRPLGARGQAGRGSSESEEAAQAAAHDLSEAARNSVKHAAEGDVGAAMQDAARMAQAAPLVFEQVTGLNTTSGHEGTAGDRAATAATDAASATATAASRAMDSMSEGATAVYSQTVGSMSGTTLPQGSKGPESTFHENVLREAALGGATGDWAGVMVQSAADEAGPAGGEDVGAMPKGSGAGGAGFAGPGGGAGGDAGGGPGGPSEQTFAEDEFAVEGGDKGGVGGASPAAGGAAGGGRGGPCGAGRASERSAQEDEFGVTKGV